MKNSIVEWFLRFRHDIFQYIKFQFVSVVAYWSDYGVYALVYGLAFTANMPVMGAVYSKIISYPVGLMIGYLLNKSWTFGVRRNVFSKYLLKYIAVNACALCASLLAIYILTNYYNISGFLSPILATVFSFSVNYSGNKIWVFE